MKKRIQVFVSSTYTDLIEDRQAAVAAILKAGHIPAGMELFAAGDESQLQTIRRWIDESDAFMLILGGRYGSLEPQSQLSYIELEYDYAVQAGKPFFAVVITEEALEARVKAQGSVVLEKTAQAQYRAFREKVLSRTSAFFSDSRDIRLAVHETLSDFIARHEFSGWISGAEVPDTKALVDRVSALTEENKKLSAEVVALQDRIASITEHARNEPSFKDLTKTFADTKVNIPEKVRGDTLPESMSLHAILKAWGERLIVGVTNSMLASAWDNFLFHTVMPKLQLYEFAESERVAGVPWRQFLLTKKGTRFLRFLREESAAPIAAPAAASTAVKKPIAKVARHRRKP